MAWVPLRVANPRTKRSFWTLEGKAKPRGRQSGDVFWEGFGYTKAHRKSVARHRRKKAKKKSWLNPRARRRYRTQEGWFKPHKLSTKDIFYSAKSGGQKHIAGSIRRKRKKSGKGVDWLSWRSNPSRRNQNILTDAVAGNIASKVAEKVSSMFTKHTAKRKKTVRRKRRNRDYFDFDPYLTGKQKRKLRKTLPGLSRMTKTKRKKAKRSSGLRIGNPHLALIGANPRRKTMARRRKRNSLRGRPRDSKGRLLKVRNKRRSSANSRRRRNTRVAPRRRRRNRTRVITKIKWRTRRVNVARRKRKSTRRRSRRRNTALAALAANPRRRRRSTRRRHAAGTHRRRRNRHSRRRNAALSGLIGRVNLMQVAEVAGGVFLGDKVTSYLGNQVNSMLGITDTTTAGLVKTGLGIVTAGFVWRFRPALGLGIAVGAANSLLNQYVFTPLWGYASPYLPGGMAGLAEYQNRTWKADNWLAAGGAPGALAGMGNNSLNRSSL